MTEITDNIDIGRGVLFYDAACGFCRGTLARFGPLLRRRGFRLEPLQSPMALELTHRPIEALMEEAHLVTPQGNVLRGIDTVLYIAASSPITRPLTWLARLPGAMPILRWAYRTFAHHRYNISTACGLTPRPVLRQRRGEGSEHSASDGMRSRDRGDPHPSSHRIPGERQPGSSPAAAAAALLIVPATFAVGTRLPAWAWMWTIAFGVYVACKWITWWPLRRTATCARSVGYLLANPGMNAAAFLAGRGAAKPPAAEWGGAILKTLAGAAFIWRFPRLLISHSPMLAGWAAMIGIVLTLHFGLLHLISLIWRRFGVEAEPLMRRPTRAISLADLWGRRWNMAVRALAYDLIFTPLVRRGFSATLVTAAVFAVSGLMHDAVISIPARGGYGLPTLYFLIQLVGLLFERTRIMRSLIRRHRWIGRAYAYIFALAPAPLLVHGPFVRNVILPFIHAIGGLS